MKRIISAFLIIALVLSSCGSVFAASLSSAPQEHNVMLGQNKKDLNLVVLGDSNSAGLGLEHYMRNLDTRALGFNVLTEGSYPDLVAKALESKLNVKVNVNPLTLVGSRYYDFLLLLTPELPLDNVFARNTDGRDSSQDTWKRMVAASKPIREQGIDTSAWGPAEIRDYISPICLSSVRKADLVIIDCGLSGMSGQFATSMGNGTHPDFTNYIENIGARAFAQKKAEFYAKFRQAFPEFKEEDSKLALVLENIFACFLEETVTLDRLVKRVHALNPGAQVVVMSMDFPLADDIVCNCMDMKDMPMGKLGNFLVDLVNDLHQVSATSDSYLYADCSKRFPVEKFADCLDAEPFDPYALDKDERYFLTTTIGSPVKYKNVSNYYGFGLSDLYGDPEDPANYDNYIEPINRLRKLYIYHKANIACKVDYESNLANLKLYISGRKAFEDFTEEEQQSLIYFANGWIYMNHMLIGFHPNQPGHEARKNAVMYALESGLNARQNAVKNVVDNLSNIFGGKNCSEKDHVNYVHLGDSLSNGFGLKRFDELRAADPDNDMVQRGINLNLPNTYPGLIAGRLAEKYGKENVSFTNLAAIGFRAAEYCYMLSDSYNYTPDYWTEKCGSLFSHDNEQLKADPEYRGLIVNSVRDADIITIMPGNNDITNYVNFTYCYEDENKDLQALAKAKGWEKAWQAQNAIVTNALALAFGKDSALPKQLSTLADAMVYSMLSFAENFDELCSIIHQMNPNAELYVIGSPLLNTPFDMKIADLYIPSAKLQAVFGKLIDNYLQYYSGGRSLYTYVAVDDLDLNAITCDLYSEYSAWTEDTKWHVDQFLKSLSVEPSDEVYGRLLAFIKSWDGYNLYGEDFPDEDQTALAEYLRGECSITEDQMLKLVGWMNKVQPGLTHPDAKTHKTIADRLYPIIQKDLDIRAFTAPKEAIKTDIKEKLREAADRRFEIKMDFAETLKKSLDVSMSNLRDAFKRLTVLPGIGRR